MGKSDAAALYSKTVGRIEMRRLGKRTGSILVFLVSYLLSTVDTLPAAAPMTVSQLALYQGADREKVLIEGAKKEGLFTLYDSHTWFRTIGGVAPARTCHDHS